MSVETFLQRGDSGRLPHPRAWSRLASLTVGIALVVAASAPAVAGPQIAPHQASYDIALQSAEASSGIIGATGRIDFEWDDACNGWIVSQKTAIRIDRSDGQEVNFGWSLDSWEAKDGTRYRFEIRENQGQQEVITRGDARLDSSGAGGTASYSLPSEREVPLPPGALFPSHHSLALLEIARDEARPFWRVVFDGTGDDGLAAVNATFIRTNSEKPDESEDWPLLKERDSWRLSLAYFGLAEEAATPEHEQILRIFNNGVVDQLTLNYGDFILKAELRALEPLSVPDC